MVLSTLVIIKTGLSMERGSSGLLMAIAMMETGELMCCSVMESIVSLMGIYSRAFLRMG